MPMSLWAIGHWMKLNETAPGSSLAVFCPTGNFRSQTNLNPKNKVPRAFLRVFQTMDPFIKVDRFFTHCYSMGNPQHIFRISRDFRPPSTVTVSPGVATIHAAPVQGWKLWLHLRDHSWRIVDALDRNQKFVEKKKGTNRHPSKKTNKNIQKLF